MRSSYGLILVIGLLLAAAGCGKEEISEYDVLKDAPQTEQDFTPVGKGSERMLVAIFQQPPERVWYFKLRGPRELVAKHKDEFNRFIDSVKFPSPMREAATWDVPKGWRSGKPKETSGGPFQVKLYATYLIGSGDNEMKLTVTPLSGKDSSLEVNVQRWRRQLGVSGSVTKANLSQFIYKRRIGGKDVPVADLIGGKATASKAMEPQATESKGRVERSPLAIPESKVPEKAVYSVAPSWQATPNQVLRGAESYLVSEGGKSAKVTVLPMTGSGAQNIRLNINVWRGQLGLDRISQEKLVDHINLGILDGRDAYYIDMESPKGNKKTVAVLQTRNGVTWSLTIKGDTEIVDREKKNFDAFLKSVKFVPS